MGNSLQALINELQKPRVKNAYLRLNSGKDNLSKRLRQHTNKKTPSTASGVPRILLWSTQSLQFENFKILNKNLITYKEMETSDSC